MLILPTTWQGKSAEPAVTCNGTVQASVLAPVTQADRRPVSFAAARLLGELHLACTPLEYPGIESRVLCRPHPGASDQVTKILCGSRFTSPGCPGFGEQSAVMVGSCIGA